MPDKSKPTPIAIRKPSIEDGTKIWDLVQECQPLEPNTSYAYVLFCHHFADTCVVAECEGEIIGFVMAYRPPPSPTSVFVWQIAVHPKMRGRGVAIDLLNELTVRDDCKDVEVIEATVSPSNEGSQALFRAFARKNDTQCDVLPYFPPRVFGEVGHEEEDLFRIQLADS